VKRIANIFGASVAIIMLASPAFAETAANYVAKAGAGDMYEIQSSKLVLASTKNPDLKRFASQMVADHSKSTADIKAAAKRSHITPKAPILDADQQSMLKELRVAAGPARDAAYVTQQKTAHSQALALHQGYAATGDKPALKQIAARIVPVVQHHVEMLNGMAM
jgi:putative membrane protein